MPGPAENKMTASCSCGGVELEAVGTPIFCGVCYCDDCQRGARQIEALPNALAVQGADGGTACILYRKDRVRCAKGASLLKSLKIKQTSATNRVVATCCNSGMFMNFDDSRHWVSAYRSRFHGNLPPIQMRVCTKFRPDGPDLSTEVPNASGYPVKMLIPLLTTRVAMLVGR
jgi:hypothetical protein